MNITNETHDLIRMGSVEPFTIQKLEYKLYECDYVIFFHKKRDGYVLYNSQANCFNYLDGSRTDNYFFKEKPKDEPWTHKDAIEYLGHSVRDANGIHVFRIFAVSEDGVYDASLAFYDYSYLLTKKWTIACTEHMVPAYNKA
jgi:hypothetical protein